MGRTFREEALKTDFMGGAGGVREDDWEKIKMQEEGRKIERKKRLGDGRIAC